MQQNAHKLLQALNRLVLQDNFVNKQRNEHEKKAPDINLEPLDETISGVYLKYRK